MRDALKTLIPQHPKQVWKEAERCLLGDSTQVRFYFDQLIGADHRDHLRTGFLFDIPSELYLEWTRKDRSQRAPLVIKWLPIAESSDVGLLRWHPALEDFIAEFGEEDGGLTELSIRLRPRSWWGSLVPHLERLIPLFESWADHKKANVRRWAQYQITGIKAEIEQEARRDDEDVVRFF